MIEGAPMKHNKIMHGLFGGGLRNRTPLPAPDNPQWWYSNGPVFFPGINGAIVHNKLSNPQQSQFGYAYRVDNPTMFSPTQPPQLFAPKGVSLVSVGLQNGNTAIISPAVNSDGSLADQGIFADSENLGSNVTSLGSDY